ncbi:MAG: M1 family peptidase [Clostridia bacterium]|nr:M1 family peptidase [Clostridia bacterium]
MLGITSATHGISNFATSGEDMTILRINLQKPLSYKEKIIFNVTYSIYIPKIKHRLGYNDYVYNLANFYPIMCVYEDGGFTEYSYCKLGDPFYSEVASYKVTLTLPKNYVAAHTGNVEQVTETEDTKTLQLEADNVRDFAICASPYFIMRTDTVGATAIKYYYVEESGAAERLEHIKSVLTAFNGYFCNYPYSTLTVVKTPFAFGGMEYPQLVYISDSLTKTETDMVITHELAHQWWYGLVGNDQIKYAWQDEALAEFSMLYYYKNNNPKLYKSYFDDSYDKYTRYASITGLTGNTAAMDNILYDYDDYRYSANVYIKGMLMLASLYELEGEALIAALSAYAKAYTYKTATPEDFVNTISVYFKCSQAAYFDAWLKGKVILL